MSGAWKKGRGKLGFMQPLIGRWKADAETAIGPVHCTRSFEPILQGAYIRLDARWEFRASLPMVQEPSAAAPLKEGRIYEELALIGVGDEGKVWFWSFTSDGKRSQGVVTDVTDFHKDAVGFEAQMPAGIARMAYWPDNEGEGFFWAAEAKTKKGWSRMVEHHYLPI